MRGPHQLEFRETTQSPRPRPVGAPGFEHAPPDPDEVLRPGDDEGNGWRPEAFAAADPAARGRLAARVVEDGLAVHDTLREQLVELLETREPARELEPAELGERVAAHLEGAPLAHHGISAGTSIRPAPCAEAIRNDHRARPAPRARGPMRIGDEASRRASHDRATTISATARSRIRARSMASPCDTAHASALIDAS